MSRLLPVLLLLATLAPGGEGKRGRLFRTKLVPGDRFTGLNTITVDMTMLVRQGDRETTSRESAQRTAKFVDEVTRAGENGVLEIRRTYNMLYTKVQGSGDERPVVHNSPLKGHTVILTEKQRRRDVQLDDGGQVDPEFKRLAGFELDWRDVFPDEPVRPGDAWEGDAKALARRLATFFDSGNRSKMRVRYEEDGERAGRRVAKLYVDWSIQGMRDRNLFTKVDLAGDVYFDLELHRVTEVDLIGKMVVRGAVVENGPPRIFKGEGSVVLKSQFRPAQVEAAAGDDE